MVSFFVVFSQNALRIPRLYKRQRFALKKKEECPTYVIREFEYQTEATQFYEAQLRQQQVKSKQATFTILKNNLSLQPQPEIKPAPPIENHYIDALQRQAREKSVNELLLEYRLFRAPAFKVGEERLPTNRELTGFFDGGSSGNPGKSAAGYHIDLEHKTLLSRAEYLGNRTNNQAEMLALILMLGEAYCQGVSRLKCFGDSLLVVNFMNRTFQPKNQFLIYYFYAADALARKFEAISFAHIGRAYNFKADLLVRRVLGNQTAYKPQKSDFADKKDE